MAGRKRGEPGRLKPAEPALGTPKRGKPQHKSAEFVATSESGSDEEGSVKSGVSAARSDGVGGKSRREEVGGGAAGNRDKQPDEEKEDESSKSSTPARDAPSQKGAGERTQFPNPEEGTEEELLVRIDSEFLQQLLQAQNQGLKNEAAGVLLSAFQEMKEMALRQALRAARLEGMLRGEGQQQPQTQLQTQTDGRTVTYSQAASTGAGLTQRETDNNGKNEASSPAALLVESTDSHAIAPERVGEFLRKTFQLEKFGLKRVGLRQISKGVAVLSHDEAGLERLAEGIQGSVAASALSVRKGGDRKATYKLVGVDPGVDITDIIPQLFAQNDLEGQEEECAIVKHFVGRGGARTVIVSVPQQVGRQLRTRQRVHVGWAICAVYLSPNLPKCNKCASYGHVRVTCPERQPTCMHCSGRHESGDCRAERRNCPACRREGRQTDREHSMSSARCPVYRELVAKATRFWA